jgi:hypothetical protein
MSSEAKRVGPISLSERILFIDVLRGMALFGILTANMRAFFAPLDCYGRIGVLFHDRADVIAQTFIDVFIQGKFISIFSFLFGLGFAIQLSRAEARGVRFMGFYPRRLLALALFGVIHGGADLGGRYPADVRSRGRNSPPFPKTPTEDLAVVGGRAVRGPGRGQHDVFCPLPKGLPQALDGSQAAGREAPSRGH